METGFHICISGTTCCGCPQQSMEKKIGQKWLRLLNLMLGVVLKSSTNWWQESMFTMHYVSSQEAILCLVHTYFHLMFFYLSYKVQESLKNKCLLFVLPLQRGIILSFNEWWLSNCNVILYVRIILSFKSGWAPTHAVVFFYDFFTILTCKAWRIVSRGNQWGRGTLDKELKAPGILRPVGVGLSSGSQSTSILHQEFDHGAIV